MPKTVLRCRCGRLISSSAGATLSSLHKGTKERPSERKRAITRLTVQIALAVRQGRYEDADRLRRLYCPELVRRREMEAARKREGLGEK